MSCRLLALLVVVMACLPGRPATAQELTPAEAPAHIFFVDGTALLERDGQIDRTPTSMPLLAGDRVRTEAGRVEVLFADGSALHLDAHTVVDFQSDEVVRLLQGRIRLSLAGPAREVFYRVDAPSAWVQIGEPGEYRIAVVQDGDVELAVLRGSAELANEQGRSLVRAGERTFARGGAAPSIPYVFNSAAWDGFDRWSEERRAQRLGASAQYLPGDVRHYAATLDTYGSWRHEPVHGYVWYPRVSAGWRPYHHGRWVSLRPYGWTWIAADPWGWPTHHYGRWGISAGAWYWIPGRQWAPAWVSWAYATDYVSWCPLGWNNRPVLQINILAGGHRYSPWHAWTVVPRRHFAGPYVNVRAAGAVRIDQRIHNTFVIQDRAPAARFAVARESAPIRSAGRFAVPRSGAGSAVRTGAATGRELTSPGRVRSDDERRLPAAARAPGTAVGRRSGESGPQAPAGSRAVRRESGAAPAASSNDSSLAAPAAARSGNEARRAASPVRAAPGSRAVARDPGAARAASLPDANASSAPAATASPSEDRAPGARRTVQPARPGADATPPPSGAVRAVPRTRAASPAGAGISGAPAPTTPQPISPARTRSQPAGPPQPGATTDAPVPRGAQPVYRSRPGGDATPPPSDGVRAVPRTRAASPAGAHSSGAPATTAPQPISPARTRSQPAAPPPPEATADAPAPRGGAQPSYRSRPEPPRGRPEGAAQPGSPAVPRNQGAPAAEPAAPVYRSAPERRAPASPPPAASPAPRSSGDRGPAAAAGSRERASEGAPAGGRARRRE